MEIIFSIENKDITFNEALDMQWQIVCAFRKYNLFSAIGISPGKMAPVADIKKEQIEVKLAKSIKKYLAQKGDLNSSRIGYALFLATLSGNLTSYLSIGLGTPKIAGMDNIYMRLDDDYIMNNFSFNMNEVKSLIIDLIDIVNPEKVICQNDDLKKVMNDNDLLYGYIMYIRTDSIIEELDNLVKLENGFIWNSVLTNYEESLKYMQNMDVNKVKLLV